MTVTYQNMPRYDLSTKDMVKTAFIKECDRQGLTLNTQKAYCLATAHHETNNTFKPVKEAYWLSEKWRMKNLWYAPWYGQTRL